MHPPDPTLSPVASVNSKTRKGEAWPVTAGTPTNYVPRRRSDGDPGAGRSSGRRNGTSGPPGGRGAGNGLAPLGRVLNSRLGDFDRGNRLGNVVGVRFR